MRLWSLHPQYLDPQGLVALWREALLARAVLRGQTKHAEATNRGYVFNGRKVGTARCSGRIAVTEGQIAHEWEHLLRKLSRRSPALYRRAGEIESWERLT